MKWRNWRRERSSWRWNGEGDLKKNLELVVEVIELKRGTSDLEKNNQDLTLSIRSKDLELTQSTIRLKNMEVKLALMNYCPKESDPMKTKLKLMKTSTAFLEEEVVRLKKSLKESRSEKVKLEDEKTKLMEGHE